MSAEDYGRGYVGARSWADRQPQDKILDDEARERWRSEFCRSGGKIAARRAKVV
jgi:hypothetical protein